MLTGRKALIQGLKDVAVLEVMAPVEQPADPLGIEIKGGYFLPQSIALATQLRQVLAAGQLPHQQKHQLLFLAHQLADAGGCE